MEIEQLRVRDDGRVIYVVVDKDNCTSIGSLFDNSFNYKSVRYLCFELREYVKEIDLSQVPLFPGLDRLGFRTFHQGISKTRTIQVNFHQFAGHEHLEILELGHIPISLSKISAFQKLKTIHLAALGSSMQQIDLSSFSSLKDVTIAGSSRTGLDLQLSTSCKDFTITGFNKVEDYDFLNRYDWLTTLGLVLIRSLSKLELRLPKLTSLAIVEVPDLKVISCKDMQLESLTLTRCPLLKAADVIMLCEQTQCKFLNLGLTKRVEDQVRNRMIGQPINLNF